MSQPCQQHFDPFPSVCAVCSSKQCQVLRSMLESLLGATWCSLLFSGRCASVELEDYYDEIVLIGLRTPNDPRVFLFELLRQSTKKARLAHRLFVAWRSSTLSELEFPPVCVAAHIVSCADAILRNRFSCSDWGYFRFCPLSLLSLIQFRLGCSFSNVCCSVFCYIGCDCPHLVFGTSSGLLLAASLRLMGECLRVVTVAPNIPVGSIPLFSFRPLNSVLLFASVLDSVSAAKARPMQLTALRASLTHRMYRHLTIRWLCPLTAPNFVLLRRPDAATLPCFVSAAFRDAHAAKEWTALANSLQQIYSEKSANADLSAQWANVLMAKMAELLPFACCKAIQRLLCLPILDVSLCTQGHFVYCLVSPFLRKLYVGAVGFKGPRAPYVRLKEHINTARMWGSRTSMRRYGRRSKYVFRNCPDRSIECHSGKSGRNHAGYTGRDRVCIYSSSVAGFQCSRCVRRHRASSRYQAPSRCFSV